MAYAVQADLNLDAQRLIELTDNSGAAGVLDSSLLGQLESEAESIVNALLSSALIAVPFTGTIPPLIKFITASLWAYRIYRHREVLDIPQTIKDDYALAWKLLQQIVAGEIRFDTAVPNLSGVPEVESSPSRGWTPRDLVT